MGGVLPLALVPVLAWAMPESVRFLVMRGGETQRVVATLRRIAPEANLEAAIFAGARKPHDSPMRQLLSGDLLLGTLLLWSAFFMSLLVVYLLSSWLPTLINGSGVSLRMASLITAMFQVGGTIGAVTIGRLIDRFNPHHVLSATYYPTASRATGVSWANGVGPHRFGAWVHARRRHAFVRLEPARSVRGRGGPRRHGRPGPFRHERRGQPTSGSPGSLTKPLRKTKERNHAQEGGP